MYDLGYDMYFKNKVTIFLFSVSIMKRASIPEDLWGESRCSTTAWTHLAPNSYKIKTGTTSGPLSTGSYILPTNLFHLRFYHQISPLLNKARKISNTPISYGTTLNYTNKNVRPVENGWKEKYTRVKCKLLPKCFASRLLRSWLWNKIHP